MRNGTCLNRSSARWIAAVALLLTPVLDAAAQPYPVRPIRFIVPTTPSGPNDVLTRIIADRLSETLGRQVIVDNRPGAGGRIGLALAAKGDTEGYTMFLGSQAQLAVHPSLYRLPYDIERDFTPVALVARVRYLLLAHPAVAVDDLQSVLRLLRARPGAMNYASVGAGSSSHIVAELFKKTARVDMVHVPYKGAAPAYADLVAGQVQFMFASPLAMSSFIKNRQVKPIAIAAPQRSGLLPEVPTFHEAGMAEFEGSAWWAVMTRAGVPVAVVTRLNREINRIIESPEVQKRLAALDVEAARSAPLEVAAYLKSERAKWAAVIKEARIALE